MKIYILTDMEGVGGVLNRSHTMSGGAPYEKAREWLTLDTNAAIEGAIEGGASDILVLDGHGANSAVNLIYEMLHPGARYVQGTPWVEYLQSFDSSFGAMFQVGAHAMAGTPGAVLEHTMSSEAWVRMRINGVETGEIGLCAAVAGQFDVPFAMVSGDDKACHEAEQISPGIQSAVVKRGISRHCAELLPMPVVHQIIREKARAAVAKAREMKPYKIEPPVEIEIEYCRNDTVDSIREREGVRKTGARSVLFTGSSVTDAFRRVMGG